MFLLLDLQPKNRRKLNLLFLLFFNFFLTRVAFVAGSVILVKNGCNSL